MYCLYAYYVLLSTRVDWYETVAAYVTVCVLGGNCEERRIPMRNSAKTQLSFIERVGGESGLGA